MRDKPAPVRSACIARLAVLLAAAPASLSAQYIGAAPPPPSAPFAGLVETPAAALSRNLRLIAQNPRDFGALIAAGRAALDLGDHQAAVGFFARAEEINPTAPAPKIGMGAATVQMGDAPGALAWFAQAQQLGASAITLGADRGLAQDLLGNQVAAQTDYRAALGGPDRDEARRRLALSLAISRDPDGATAILQPLLNRRDPGAQRVRAFILALGGDRPGARRAIEAAMPGSAARIDPFFMVLPSLSVEQKAAAVHLGVFPTASEIRLVAVEPVRIAAAAPPPPSPQRRAATKAVPIKARKVAVGKRTVLPPTPITSAELGAPVAAPVARSIAQPTPIAATVSARADPVPVPIEVEASPPQQSAITVEPTPLSSPEPPVSIAAAPAATIPPASTFADLPAPGFSAEAGVAAGDRLSSIEKLLAQADQAVAPPASRPKVERPPETATTSTAKTAEARKAEVKKAAARKLADEKKAREAIGVAGTNWVQLAGGANADRMGTEFRKLAAKSSTLRKRGGYVTDGKDYFRLLAGPFDSKSEAQTFVNQLAKDGVDGFSWTRTPPTIRIEKIPSK